MYLFKNLIRFLSNECGTVFSYFMDVKSRPVGTATVFYTTASLGRRAVTFHLYRKHLRAINQMNCRSQRNAQLHGCLTAVIGNKSLIGVNITETQNANIKIFVDKKDVIWVKILAFKLL